MGYIVGKCVENQAQNRLSEESSLFLYVAVGQLFVSNNSWCIRRGSPTK
jgi:hypothetical protein